MGETEELSEILSTYAESIAAALEEYLDYVFSCDIIKFWGATTEFA